MLRWQRGRHLGLRLTRVVVEVDMGAVGAGIIIEMVDLIDINMAETVHVLIERISQSSRIYVMRIVV